MDLGSLIKDKRVLVTGASAGLGAHFATLAARCGAAVAVGARRKHRLDTLVGTLGSLSRQPCVAVELDVTSEGSVRDAMTEIEARLGMLDLVVNNAGIARPAPAEELSTRDFDEVIATNLRGVFLVATEAARRWKRAKRPGIIVNIASILADRVTGHAISYVASKAAVKRMTEAMALEWARYAIRVNALQPGYIETDLNADFFATEPGLAMIKRIPMRRLGRPEELDGAFLLLATDASAWMTGQSIVVDGGHLVSTL